ncbi:glycosyltransferase family 4 protein [Noviherbaspirillum massiliense]|uniref:glycosyltransferase family 4 protein n=1 Tax=Noviherbaspirillum massiliense TaxID=1465823 RepID=UPI0002DEBD74|nr:glycosyltransferase family 4 protein [Noviherbaspirillum massiliense]
MESVKDGGKPPLRLALISSQAFSIANFRGPLVREMVSHGMEVYALAPDYDDASRAAVRSLGAEPIDYSMIRAGISPFKDIFSLFQLVRKLRILQVNASFAYFIKPVIYGTIAARLANVPKRYALIEGAGYVFMDEERPSIRRRLLRSATTWLYRLGLSQADRVFMLNQDDKSLFVSAHMVAAEKVRLLNGIGLDLNHYHVTNPVLHPVCFILIGRLLREKGIYDYVTAARKVKALYPEVRFLMLGSVDVNPGSLAESEVRAWVDEGLIEWPGQVADVRSWLAQASVFVLPSYREGLPRSTQEAMAMGRPVITTDAPGCRETVEEAVNGFMVPVRSPEALAQAMLRFVGKPESIISMGRASRNMAEKKFDVHKINEQIMASILDCHV